MMSARPVEIQKVHPVPITEDIGPAESYIYTLMVNLEMNWEEAIAHFLAQGRVCCNPDCGKSIEQRLLQSRYCNFSHQQRAYLLRKRRGDTRLRLGRLEEN